MAHFILDSRERRNKFSKKQFEALGHTISVEKLDFGDLCKADNKLNVIDFKADLLELAQNLCSQDHKRLKAEITKCFKAGGEITFLCLENGMNRIEDIEWWEIPRHYTDKYEWKCYDNVTKKYMAKSKVSKLYDTNKCYQQIFGDNLRIVGVYDKKDNMKIKHQIRCENKLIARAGEYYTQTTPKQLMLAVKRMCEPNRYYPNKTVKFEFADKKNIIEKILKILGD